MPANPPAADVSVRTARRGDAPALGRLQALTWRETYADLLPADRLAALTPDAVTASWSAAISAPPGPRHRVLVGLEAGEVVGFAAVGPADPPTGTDDSSVGELALLLVAPAHRGRGHGSRLVNAAADTLRDNGFDAVIAWVPEIDDARIAFLAAAGFAIDGATRTLDLSGDGRSVLREARLVATLTRS
jgi:GNAT superfamily N-acetyltransferase